MSGWNLDAQVDRSLNRLSWTAAVREHEKSKGDFVDIGLWPPLLDPAVSDLLRLWTRGEDPAIIVQPCCGDGRELMYVLHTYGGSGMGFDFVDENIERAISWKDLSGLSANFVCGEALEVLEGIASESFNVALITLGTLWWFPDIGILLRALRRVVAPGGRLLVWDFHPLATCLDDNLGLKVDYPDKVTRRFHRDGVEDYVAEERDCVLPSRRLENRRRSNFANPHAAVDYVWTIGEIVTSLASAGWILQGLREMCHIWGERYRRAQVEVSPMTFGFPPSQVRLPMTFVADALRTI